MDSFGCNVRSVSRAMSVVAGLVMLSACGSRPPAPVVDRSTPRVVDNARPVAAAAPAPSPARPASEPSVATRPPVAVAQALPARSSSVASTRSAVAADSAASEPPPLRFEPVTSETPAANRSAPSAASSAAPAAGQPPTASRSAPTASPPPGPGLGTFQAQEPAREPVVAAASQPVAPQPAPTPPAQPPQTAAAATPAAPAPRAAAPSGAGSDRFIWPVPGKVLEPFSEPQNTAVYLDGRLGDPVSAAADGKVIFSGQGPKGYGNLLIVKHDDELLSVYGHNRSLLVKEGEQVKRGQKIAELGNSDSERPRLRFEIRRDGRPVDPVRYLPSR